MTYRNKVIIGWAVLLCIIVPVVYLGHSKYLLVAWTSSACIWLSFYCITQSKNKLMFIVLLPACLIKGFYDLYSVSANPSILEIIVFFSISLMIGSGIGYLIDRSLRFADKKDSLA